MANHTEKTQFFPYTLSFTKLEFYPVMWATMLIIISCQNFFDFSDFLATKLCLLVSNQVAPHLTKKFILSLTTTNK